MIEIRKKMISPKSRMTGSGMIRSKRTATSVRSRNSNLSRAVPSTKIAKDSKRSWLQVKTDAQ